MRYYIMLLDEYGNSIEMKPLCDDVKNIERHDIKFTMTEDCTISGWGIWDTVLDVHVSSTFGRSCDRVWNNGGYEKLENSMTFGRSECLTIKPNGVIEYLNKFKEKMISGCLECLNTYGDCCVYNGSYCEKFEG
jgi:hypothetical protein